jgi:hypothetical protein
MSPDPAPPAHLEEMGAADYVQGWVDDERHTYANVKFSGANREMIERYIAECDDRAFDFVLNYLKRAQMMTLATPQGRQAMGKALVTLTDYLETAVQVHGPMPEPGFSSGEIREWKA